MRRVLPSQPCHFSVLCENVIAVHRNEKTKPRIIHAILDEENPGIMFFYHIKQKFCIRVSNVNLKYDPLKIENFSRRFAAKRD